jgi:hypothetical protein
MLNRAAVIIHYKQPFVDWINAADPDSSNKVSLDEANEETSVYLIEVEDQEELDDWLELNYDILFEEELNGWYSDPALWPQDRSLLLFKEWCSLELHSVVFDTGGSPLEDDEI